MRTDAKVRLGMLMTMLCALTLCVSASGENVEIIGDMKVCDDASDNLAKTRIYNASSSSSYCPTIQAESKHTGYGLWFLADQNASASGFSEGAFVFTGRDAGSYNLASGRLLQVGIAHPQSSLLTSMAM